MYVHLCCCILFCVVWFEVRFQIDLNLHFEIALEIQKRKMNFPSSPSLFSAQVGLLPHGPASPFLRAGPAQPPSHASLGLPLRDPSLPIRPAFQHRAQLFSLILYCSNLQLLFVVYDCFWMLVCCCDYRVQTVNNSWETKSITLTCRISRSTLFKASIA